MRRELALNVNKVQAQPALAGAIGLATVLTIRQALVAFQMTLSARQTSCTNALGLARGCNLVWRAIHLRHSHETAQAVPTRL